MIQKTLYNKNRIVGLDIFRISLVLLIFLFHSRIHIGCSYGIFNYFISRGAIAMTAFFMLSGYSLTLVYGKQNILTKETLKTFYSKRCFSLLPQYFVLAFLYVIFLGNESVLENIILLPVELFGLQSTYCSLFSETHNSGTWFISCLIICYIIYPFLQHITTLLSDKYIVIQILILSFILLWGPIVQLYFGTATLYDNPFYRVIEFYIGLLIAHINIIENTSGGGEKLIMFLRSKVSLCCSIIVLVCGVCAFAYEIKHIFGFSDYMLNNWIALPCYIIMLFSLGYIKMPYLNGSKILIYLSSISYSFFLAQFFCWSSCKWLFATINYNANWFRISSSFIFCLLIAILMYELIQRRLVPSIKSKLLKL